MSDPSRHTATHPDQQPDATQSRALVDRAERILCDLDGCLISGSRVLPGAQAFVRRYASKLVLVSNNSTDTAETLSRRLAHMGLSVPETRVILAGETALARARDTVTSGEIRLLAGATMQERARKIGLRPASDRPEAIVLCRDATRPQLEAALPLLERGVPMIVANPDLTHPGEHGPVIETGALLALLKACVPHPNITLVGKPSAYLFHAALGSVPPAEAVMIGDNLETDIAGARALGIRAIHVSPSGLCALLPDLGQETDNASTEPLIAGV